MLARDTSATDLADELRDARRLAMAVLMTPDMANFAGKIHGGAILKMLDQVAYACASRYAGHYVVTLSVDQVQFRSPVNVGDLVHALASVNFVGNTSMEAGIKVIAENTQSRQVRHALSCFFTMVAVDDAGRPMAVAPLVPATAEEQRRFLWAQLRRRLRRELQEKYEALCREHPDGPPPPADAGGL